ncbi:MAG TPA: succinylglutamate desuccinylase/aspartoacylase family protein [Thermodesulfobacteriota bacterium]|nr:succinylglutamate desuccinylase/aspartoacylase family protein [Thermodesulfobacteriota bacterium]
MVRVHSKALNKTLDIERLIGKYTNNTPGPTVICVGGIHGNEPSGIFALKEVLKELQRIELQFKGELIAFAGNLTALSRGVRFVDEDLNRIWLPERIETLKSVTPSSRKETVESMEQRELLRVLTRAFDDTKCPVYVLALHTTSSVSAPFITLGEVLRNRDFILNFPVPTIKGIEKYVQGTLLSYISELGFIDIGFEAGQHDALSSIKNSVAAIWIALANAGCVNPDDFSDFDEHYETLTNSAKNVQGVYEVIYRYGIEEGEDFVMEPGFINFQEIEKGQVLARNRNGKIHALEDGRIFMPLYQKQGRDGFFIVLEINPELA